MTRQQQMSNELDEREIFDQARSYAFEYLDGLSNMSVFPADKDIANLSQFDEVLSIEGTSAGDILNQLHTFGAPATPAQIGGRYFGFVNGGVVPASLGVKWLTDIWDQCAGLYLTSPINAKLESVCEAWLKDVFQLPKETVAGFVSGTSMANFCGLAAGRYKLLNQQGWDINEKGLNGAPQLRILAHRHAHASVIKVLALLGYGSQNVEWLDSDDQGRLDVASLPKLDAKCLVILQAGNVNTGAFDDFDQVCGQANAVGAWVHIDGAFGLWAAASKQLRYLTKGMEKASSWAVDGHKTLNTPYDSGVILCRDRNALVTALQATGEYIILGDRREPLLYTPEMSKRARAIEMWATMKYLGKSGMDEMISGFHWLAKQFAAGVEKLNLRVLNDVVFNQVLVAAETEQQTNDMLSFIQRSGKCWLGGTKWNGRVAIRMSICSWATTPADIDRTLEVFAEAKRQTQ